MQRRSILLKLIILLVVLTVQFHPVQNCFAGSVINWHKIINGTNEVIIVTLFESYPVNQVHSKLLKPNESLEVDNVVEKPSYFYLILVTRNPNTENEIVLKKIYSWREYTDRYLRDQEEGLVVTEEDLKEWSSEKSD